MKVLLEARPPGAEERDGRRFGAGLLLTLVAIGAYRLWCAWPAPVSRDQNGTLYWLGADYEFVLTHFRAWLTMNWYIAGLKLANDLGCGVLGYRALSVVGATLGLLFFARFVRRRFGTDVLLVLLALVVVNPWLTQRDSVIRSYPLATGAMLAVIDQLDRWWSEWNWRAFRNAAALTALALVLTSQALFFLMFPWLVGGTLVVTDSRFRAGPRAHLIRMGVTGVATVAIVLLFHLPFAAEMRQHTGEWREEAFTSLSYVPGMVELLLGVGWMPVLLAFAGLGALLGCLRAPRLAALCAAAFALPFLVISALGISHYPWAFARFHAVFVYPLLLLAAYGATRLPLRTPRQRELLAGTLALIVLVVGVPRQLDVRTWIATSERWNEAFAYVVARATPDSYYAIQYEKYHWFEHDYPDLEGRVLAARHGPTLGKFATLERGLTLWIVTAGLEAAPGDLQGAATLAQRFGAVSVYRVEGGAGSGDGSFGEALFEWLDRHAAASSRGLFRRTRLVRFTQDLAARIGKEEEGRALARRVRERLLETPGRDPDRKN